MKMRKVKLFCIPHAGGSATSYLKLKKYINSHIEVCPIELAGRGRRFNESFYDSIEEAVYDVYKIIESNLDYEYAILGHSMGSLIAFELAHHIIKLKKQKPIHIFFSGRKSPNIIYTSNQIHKLPEEEFKNKIFEFSGTPKEIFENEKIFRTFLPILRADFKICEQYKYKEKPSKLNFDISILNGNMDDIKIKHIADWRKFTSKKCNIHFFQGGHFYINHNWNNLSDFINSIIDKT